ncbi:protein FAR1-RELATED SEQUENCE 6-like [Olea europaea var. sylvestris]|uniref:protein FAR1-RELATED SEQUENCE 6-like n=1 Tax=Olea europaea var. sylvestris TaxID=158386 RepID=UPI000C1D4D51|nr:protein FAR1-RELATED SEQUENCE 6-like [Olea europaea var. sylvestris]
MASDYGWPPGHERQKAQLTKNSTVIGCEIIEAVEDDVRVELEHVNVEDNMSVCVDETRGGDGVIVPEVGMKFKDENEVYDFYGRYAFEDGFRVRKRNSKKDDNGVLQYVTLTCSCEGRRNSSTSGSLKPQPTMQTDCKARISATFDYHGLWGFRCTKSFNSAVVEAGGYENLTCVEKDYRNYIEKVRRLKHGEGDAVAIQSYFSEMQAGCSGFYFSIDLDEDSREVQAEFIGKVYYDIISTADVCPRMTYEGIICRHAIVVLICNDVRVLPDRYVLRRWRRDVSRAHTRVAVNYSGLVSTPGQLRYDRMCQAFATIANLAAEDEGQTYAIMEWIGVQEKELMSSRSVSGSNVLLQLLDPNTVNKNGAPKRFRRKGSLELTSKKPTAPSKGKRPTARRTCPLDGALSIQAHQQ